MADWSTCCEVEPLIFLEMPGTGLPAGLWAGHEAGPARSAVMTKALLPRPASLPEAVTASPSNTTPRSPTRWTLAGVQRSSRASSRGRRGVVRLVGLGLGPGRRALRHDFSQLVSMMATSSL